MSPTRRQPAHELRRAGLTRDRVLGTAVDLADEEGLDGLSMRKLAKRLGVEAMSLYNHIPGQGTLAGRHGRSGIWRDRACHRSRSHGRRRCGDRAISTRAALKRHSWAVGLMEARANPGESNLRLHEAALGCLRQAGFSIAAAIHAYSVQDAYIYGFALQERTLALETRDEWRSVAKRNLDECGPGTRRPTRPPPRCCATSPTMASAMTRSSCSDSTSSSTALSSDW